MNLIHLRTRGHERSVDVAVENVILMSEPGPGCITLSKREQHVLQAVRDRKSTLGKEAHNNSLHKTKQSPNAQQH